MLEIYDCIPGDVLNTDFLILSRYCIDGSYVYTKAVVSQVHVQYHCYTFMIISSDTSTTYNFSNILKTTKINWAREIFQTN